MQHVSVSDRQIVCALICAYGRGDTDDARIISNTSEIDEVRTRSALLDLCSSLLGYLAWRSNTSWLQVLESVDEPTYHLRPGPYDFGSSNNAVVHYLLERCSILPQGTHSLRVEASLYDLAWHLFGLVAHAQQVDTIEVARRITALAADYHSPS